MTVSAVVLFASISVIRGSIIPLYQPEVPTNLYSLRGREAVLFL